MNSERSFNCLEIGERNTFVTTKAKVINNTADSTPDLLPDITKTPDGAAILFVTASSTTSVLSYYVAATDKILVSYIGNFT